MSHYRDYEAEEKRHEFNKKLFKDRVKEIEERLDKGELAEILADLSLNKQQKF